MVGGGRGLQRPAVICLAIGPRPDAGDVRRNRAFGLQLVDLTLKRRCDLAGHDLAGTRVPVAGDVLRLRPADEQFYEAAALLRILEGDTELGDRPVGEEGGRNEPLRSGGAKPSHLAVELRRILRKSREVGFGVGAGLDRMIGVEELRGVDVGADVLDDDVGRIAIAADGDVAVRERKSLEAGAVGALHDLDAGAGWETERGRVDRLGPLEIGGDHLGKALLPAAEWSPSS